ncbi:hypothetical protein HYFRA_00013638 [Hymenoscyphus fraxineus]|uniref:Cytochrome c oxidase polypeptide II n=1 Tax=Hymenoscyphus fraxineus TaxID=746836 RepID=A0A9N9PWE8_9HELO|nr:hypothetical protein HYFRA_00013638 [Hymenoscyphus fraxineus]
MDEVSDPAMSVAPFNYTVRCVNNTFPVEMGTKGTDLSDAERLGECSMSVKSTLRYQYPDFLNADEEFIEFDSYLVPESDLEDGALRMLEVDNRVIIPELTHVRFIVTAADVIHKKVVNFRVNQGTDIYLYDIEGKILFYASKSLNQIRGDLGIHYATCTNCIVKGNSYLNYFRITNTPIEGIKCDAYPGRLNQVSVLINREGISAMFGDLWYFTQLYAYSNRISIN